MVISSELSDWIPHIHNVSGAVFIEAVCVDGWGYFRGDNEITASCHREWVTKLPIYGEGHKITSDVAITFFIAFDITVHCIDGRVVYLHGTMMASITI